MFETVGSLPAEMFTLRQRENEEEEEDQTTS
jgi:hypothetical protein